MVLLIPLLVKKISSISNIKENNSVSYQHYINDENNIVKNEKKKIIYNSLNINKLNYYSVDDAVKLNNSSTDFSMSRKKYLLFLLLKKVIRLVINII